MSTDVPQPTIFLSYAHDDRAKAQRLAAALEQAGYIVWWDGLIEGGAQFDKSIREALEAADAVVVLWSRHSVESDWVRDEAAQGRDRRRLVPLSLDGSAPPLGFRQYQMIDMSGWRGKADAPQLDAIRRAIAAAVGQQPLALHRAPPRITRRRAIAAGAGTVAALAGGGALVAWGTGLLGPAEAKSTTIAVLPFKYLGGDPGQAYLADGVTEEVRSALARNARLMVLAATSSNTVRDEQGDAKSIARKLGVAYLLEGSIQRAGDMVRVATNLTDGDTGFSVWSQRVERRLHDIFAFESDVARMVSNALSVQMATDAPAPGGTRNVKAYEAYLRGKSLYNAAKGEEADREARANFEVAIAADPNFALGHAALSRVLASIAASNAEASELKPLYTAAVAEAQRAIELAPTLPQAHWRWAMRDLRAFSMSAAPGRPMTRRINTAAAMPTLSCSMRYTKYGPAVFARRATRSTGRLRLTLSTRAPIARPGPSRLHHTALTDAITRGRRALELNPKMSNAHASIGDSLMMLGQLDDARAAYLEEPSAMFRLRGLAVLEHRAGNQPAAERALAQLISEVGDAAMYQQAEVMAQWGQAGRGARPARAGPRDRRFGPEP